TTCAIVLTRAIYSEGFKTVAYRKNAVKVVVSKVVVDDGFIEVTQKSRKGNLTAKYETRHIDGIRLSKCKTSYYYRTKDKQSKETRNEATTSTKKGNVNSGASLSHEDSNAHQESQASNSPEKNMLKCQHKVAEFIGTVNVHVHVNVILCFDKKEDGIFLLQDKYIGDILKKFRFSDIRSSNTPMDKENPWRKDGTGKNVELHLYRSMIGYLMYLTASRPDIIFAVCACARHQVTPK
nr:hypothetical protein [Tanacetum cinerariifolium]